MNTLLEAWPLHVQAKQLMKHCVTRLKLCLTLETLADTAIVADKMNHEGLQQACIDFAMQEENRWAPGHAFHSASWYCTKLVCLRSAAGHQYCSSWGNPSLEACSLEFQSVLDCLASLFTGHTSIKHHYDIVPLFSAADGAQQSSQEDAVSNCLASTNLIWQTVCGTGKSQAFTLHNSWSVGCRSALQAGEQKVLKRIIADAPDLALKLMGEALKQGVPKEAEWMSTPEGTLSSTFPDCTCAEHPWS